PAHHDIHSFPTRRSSDLSSAEKLGKLNSRFPPMFNSNDKGTLNAEFKERFLLKFNPFNNSLCSVIAIFLTPLALTLSRRLMPFIDRKSTRLNSSHVKISY